MNTRHLRPEDLRGKRWAGYIRESSQEQTDRGTPVERQRADILRAAEELGMVSTGPTWYERTGSGEAESAELRRALADGRAGRYDVLVVFSTSRFARNMAESVIMRREFSRAGILIYFAADRIISGSRSTRLTENIKAAVDEEENETRRLYIAGGFRERQLSGRWVGSIPYGYARHLVDFPDGTRGWDGTLELDPSAAQVVRRIFRECLAGEYPRTIALRLNADGVRSATGRPWSRSVIGKMLTNPVYTGRMVRYRHRGRQHYFPESDPRDGTQEIDANIPAIVTPEEQHAVLEVFARRSPRRRQRPHSRYPLSGVLRCGACGGRMTGCSTGRVRYYRCAARSRNGSCDAPSIRADVAERDFADWLDGYSLPENWRDQLEKRDLARDDEAARRAQLEGQLARLRNLYVLGDIGSDEYRARAAEIKSALALTVAPSATSIEVAANMLDGHTGQAWLMDHGSGEQRAAVPNEILNAAVVRDRRIAEFVVRAEYHELFEVLRTRVPLTRNSGARVRIVRFA